jgi:hypothetical protein
MQTTSIYLNPDTWDIGLDDKGNLALCSNPYAVAQDVACSCSTLLGEVYYDTTLGIPFYQKILGHWPGTQLIASKFQAEALKLPTVQSAYCTPPYDRKLRKTGGVMTLVDTNGVSSGIIL